jgi:hypothetical protein
MATYQVQINERTSLGKSAVAFLRSIPQAVKLIRTKEKPKSDFNLYESLDRAFADVRLMMDGKKRKKPLDELIEELRRERDNELCNSID